MRENVQNVIFDLGGVILDLDISNSFREFSKIGNISAEDGLQHFHNNAFFKAYEKGEISSQAFRSELKGLLGVDCEDTQIDTAWNAMLLGIPEEKLTMLMELKNNYRTYLLSNTNAIHIEYIDNMLLARGRGQLSEHFHTAYYSHDMGMRKPDSEIYKTLLEKEGLVASESIFIDDLKENIEGAKALGIQTWHLTDAGLLLDGLKNG